MKAFIANDRVHELFIDEVASQLPPEMNLVDVPDGTKPRSYYKNGKITAPKEGPDFPDNYINAQLAKQELVISDRVMIRFQEDVMGATTQEPKASDIDNWKDYRTQLRAIIALEWDETTTPIPLPPRPDVPWPDSPLNRDPRTGMI